MTLLLVLYLLSYRYRVKPADADTHAIGCLHSHDIVTFTRHHWLCLTCGRSNERRYLGDRHDLMVTAIICFVAVDLLWAGTVLGGIFL